MPTPTRTNPGRPPAGRPRPRRVAPATPLHPLPPALLVLFIVVAIGAGAWLARDDSNAFPTPNPAPPPPAGSATATVPVIAQPPPTPTPAVPPATAPTATPPSASCPETCLVRLIDPTGLLGNALAPRGLLPAYGADGWLWAAAPADLIAALQGEGRDVVLVDDSVDTVSLYAVRLPAGGDESLIAEVGAIVDHVDDRYIVAAATLPPPVDHLVDAGIAVEKFPPPRTLRPETGQLPPLTRAIPFRAELSTDGLTATILDLENAGDPAKVENSRYYTDRGSVTAAEYIYRRMADYGLNVWYEGFVADTGATATNVVGELPGRDPARTYLVLAHYDSAADGGPAPGADDNASGVAAMLEIARILSGYDLAFSIRFAALTGEEAGLQGAKAFANRAASDDQEFTGAFNLDALGNPARANELIVNADANSVWLQDLIAGVNADYSVGENLLLRQNPAIVGDDTILQKFNSIPTVSLVRAVLGENPVHHTAEDVLANTNVDSIAGVAYLTLLALADLLSP